MPSRRRTENGGRDDIPLTKAVRAALRAEIRRTGTTAIQLLSGADDLPEGLTSGIVNRWVGGVIRTAPRTQFAYVTALWAALPDDTGRTMSDGTRISKRGRRYPVASETWIEVTGEMAVHLRAEMVRTGVDFEQLLRDSADRPEGLTPRIIQGWLYRHAKTTREAHWAFVTRHLAEMRGRTEPLSPLRRSRKASINNDHAVR